MRICSTRRHFQARRPGSHDVPRSAAGLDPQRMQTIDNSCPDDAIAAGASAAEASKEKLEWRDVFELTEWFRPGTIKRSASFDPANM